jgi:hypothetical protein
MEVERGPHHTVWQTVDRYLTSYAREITRTNEVVELASGLNFWSPEDGSWVRSSAQIELIENDEGGAVARRGPFKALFSADIASANGAINLLAGGKTFRVRIQGLAIEEASSRRSVLIAELRHSVIGEVLGENQVIWRDAFDSIKADVRAIYTPGRFECDVILREAFAPSEWGLNDHESCRIQVWSEVLSQIEPVTKIERVLENPEDKRPPRLVDQSLDFGAFEIGNGVAFSLRGRGAVTTKAIPVAKEWTKVEGRQFLIESVDYPSIEPLLLELNPRQEAMNRRGRNELLAVRGPVASKTDLVQLFGKRSPDAGVTISKSKMQLASLNAKEAPGVVLDWAANLIAATNFTFSGMTTYVVNAAITLSGTTTLEGGTVVKFTNYNSVPSAMIRVTGPLVCKTSQFHPATFTSIHDHTVGAIVGSLTNTPSGYYGARGLEFTGDFTNDVHDVHFRYVRVPIHAASGAQVFVSHSQLAHAERALENYSKPLTLRNVLVHESNCAIESDFAIHSEQATFHQIGTLRSGTGTLYLTNSLVMAVTNGVTYFGSNVVTNQSDIGIFQTVAGGKRYLAENSPYRNAGTTNITAALLADLAKRTTTPPSILTNSFTGTNVFSLTVERATGTPSLGYHYDPLDFIFSAVVVNANAVLALTNGVSIGIAFGNTNYGCRLAENGQLWSEGKPHHLNRIVRLHSVQEAPVVAPSGSALIADTYPTTLFPQLRLRFTHVPLLSTSHFINQQRSNGRFGYFELRDCDIRGGQLFISPVVSEQTMEIANTLLYNIRSEFYSYAACPLTIQNCLFYNGKFEFAKNTPGSPNWSLYNNHFFRTTSLTSAYDVTHNYNAYEDGCERLLPTNSTDVVVSGFAFSDGPLGSFYHQSTNLMDKGSVTNAGWAGLFHYTVQTNQTKEAGSRLDIGYHYVVVNASGKPADLDGDGLPDYLEDRNGNGASNPGETDWQIYNSLNTLTMNDSVEVFKPLK